MNRGRRWLGTGLLTLGLAMAAFPADRKGPKRPNRNAPPASVFKTDVPEQTGNVVLGRPTKTSVTVSLLLHAATEGALVWGLDAKALPAEGLGLSLAAGEPRHVLIDGLRPNTRYYYEMRDPVTRRRLLPLAGTGSFHTARSPGSAFTFTVTADSHLDERTDPDTYARTMANAGADDPDFHIDLGDTFMTEKHGSRDSALGQYLAQRHYFGALCHSAPLFLVLGNHDGETPTGPGRDAADLAVWSNRMRKRYFANPVPGLFYAGNAAMHPQAGPLEDYYAWEWGDALFVVLDPFWYSGKQRGREDNWARTLGAGQYQWLRRTLGASNARLKLVFVHHLVGGLDQGRGGAEAAPFYEWGGKNQDGTDGLAQNRPGWPMPIHQLLVRNHVSIVFHGHDHLYARQELDGIVYQEVPQPGDPRGGTRNAADYGYTNGMILGSSGHLRARVANGTVCVEYILSRPGTATRNAAAKQSVADAYTVGNPAPAR